MRKLVSSANALAADRAAETEFGYPPVLLMEEAAVRLQAKIEELIERRALPLGTPAYLVGPGNNGGDGWAMARHAHLRGQTVRVVAPVAPQSPSCRQQALWAAQVGVPILAWPSAEAEHALEAASFWVDALWGTGQNGELRPDATDLLSGLEARRVRLGCPVVAVDLPSGLHAARRDSEAALTATWTLSAGPAKDFCYLPAQRGFCGSVVEVALAFPRAATPSASLWEESDLATLLPSIDRHAHKGTRGHVALVGGAPGMTGALVLAARSAAATGAGLVSLGLDLDLVPLVAPSVAAFQVRPTGDVLTMVDRYDAVVIGPGWGRTDNRVGALAAFWALEVPLVLDADGLVAWAALGLPPRSAPTVATPHPGEFRRLGWSDEVSVEAAASLSVATGVCLVLKGAVTWILAPDGRRAVWDGAEPALGTGGSGDCLAGVVGALLATGEEPFDAACEAVALHGTAGRRLASERGWFTADLLPEALARTALACRTLPRPL